MISQNNIYISSRILFVIRNCPYCLIYKEFIERINTKLPPDKKIQIVDCDSYQEWRILPHPLFKKFFKHFKTFPILFIDGMKVEGVNSREELEAWMKTYLEYDFVVPEEISYKFSKNCYYKKEGLFRKRLICEDE